MPTEPSAVRSANRQTGPSRPDAALVFDAGGFIVTVAPTGDVCDVRAAKNAAERFVRVARKALAAGITDTHSFVTLLNAIAEAARLANATKEATERVTRLVERRVDSPAGPPTSTTHSPAVTAGPVVPAAATL